jgi:UDP-N-acetylmuramoylalanine--D-glutamate ligase
MNSSNHQAGARAVVVGLGRSGFSAARYLLAQGFEVAVTDSRAEPPELPRLEALERELKRKLRVRRGGFDVSLLDGAELLVVSPGVPSSMPRAPRVSRSSAISSCSRARCARRSLGSPVPTARAP